nr:hypothetical protein [Bacillus pumilus]
MAEENEKKEFQINTDVDPLTSLLVSDVLNKNNITDDQKANISDDQRRMILKLVEDLQKKANDFVEQQDRRKKGRLRQRNMRKKYSLNQKYVQNEIHFEIVFSGAVMRGVITIK